MIDALPYSKLAPFYDGMMEHVNYEKWARYIDKIFKHYDASIRDVCELACGTGSLAVALSKFNYRLTCSDMSADMIQCAAEKAQRAGVKIDFSAVNMLEFHSEKEFDAVLCLYDSVNYLPEESDVRKLLANTWTLMKPGALFIFDVCTEFNSLENFNHRYEYDPERRYKRRSYYVPDQRIQVNEIEMDVNGHTFHERHCQVIYRLSDIQQEIRRSSFRTLNVFENLSFQKGSERSERVHFILQRT